MHYGFHQKEQDLNNNGDNCSFIVCIRKSRHNTPLNSLSLFDKYFLMKKVNRYYNCKNKQWR